MLTQIWSDMKACEEEVSGNFSLSDCKDSIDGADSGTVVALQMYHHLRSKNLEELAIPVLESALQAVCDKNQRNHILDLMFGASSQPNIKLDFLCRMSAESNPESVQRVLGVRARAAKKLADVMVGG